MIRFRNVGCGYSLLQPLFEPCLRQEVLSEGDLFFMNSVFYFTALRQRTDKFISSRGSDRRGDASPALLRLKFSSWCTLHCTGLFALHVKLDQHLLNLNRKESRKLILLQLCHSFVVCRRISFNFKV